MSRAVFVAQWWYRGRAVVVVEFREAGSPDVTVRVGPDRVDAVSREKAAHWLREYLPRLSHDEAYARLWTRD